MGSLKGGSRKAKDSFGNYQLLENPDYIKREELEEKLLNAQKDEAIWKEKLEKLKKIDHQAVEMSEEAFIKKLYEEDFQTKFEPPVPQGLKDILPDQSVNYSIDWGKISEFKIEKLKTPDKIEAAFKAAIGLQALGDVEFKSQFGVAKADFEAFLGARAKGSVSASYDWNQVILEAVADFFVGASLSCNGELTIGSVDTNLSAKLSGKAIVGIEGVGKGQLKLTPAQLSAGLELAGFIGAKAEAEGSFTATLFGRPIFDSKLSASASVGIGASLSVGLEAGVEEIGFKFKTDLTVGVGAGTSAEVSLNVLNCAMTFKEFQTRLVNIDKYLEGYADLRLQEVEWKMKIKTITRRVEERLKVYTDQVNDFKSKLKELD